MATRLPADLEEALRGAMTPKFLATVGPSGDPNIVPVVSLQPAPDGNLCFGEFLMNKSRRNLGQNRRVGVLVMTEALRAWPLRGTFMGFQESGALFEQVSTGELFRYNAYTGVRAAGLIRVDEVGAALSFSKGEVLAGYLYCRVLRPLLTPARRRRVMPGRVEEKFGSLQALRAGAFLGDDGWPRVFPSLSSFAAGASRLIIADRQFHAVAEELATGERVAMALLTPQAVAYQVKGDYAGTRAGAGLIDLTSCYSASPPLVGERLDRAAPPTAA
ncbi:MAG TPA: pyridoxamine 5'-phosphate oxidase family protein [Polyangia bacterium]|jgi:hypothetical protein